MIVYVLEFEIPRSFGVAGIGIFIGSSLPGPIRFRPLPKTLSGMTAVWSRGNEGVDGPVPIQLQLIVLRRRSQTRVRLPNIDRLLLVWLYRL
jgi:hypothetical protein